jgi:UDP-N-acetylglucosamine--N-acetylmuramyl-(pentapeptide) pyrophosphoryl-undecaprenol N-acetylglucosamine transferase
LPQAVLRLQGSAIPEIRHQAGKGWVQQTAQDYAATGLDARVEEFIEDMAQAYAWADLVVCRAGALTVSELAAAGIGAVLVPFPHAVDDHQTRNAEYLVDVGAACLLPESECDAHTLSRLLQALLSDRAGLLRMANAARSVAMPDAADQVAKACMEFVRP